MAELERTVLDQVVSVANVVGTQVIILYMIRCAYMLLRCWLERPRGPDIYGPKEIRIPAGERKDG